MEEEDGETRRGKAEMQQTGPGQNGGSEKMEERKKKVETEGRETSSSLAALVVQCKVRSVLHVSTCLCSASAFTPHGHQWQDI